MKKLIIVAILLLPLLFGFEYDPNLADYPVMGTVHTIPNEAWYCDINYRGTLGPTGVIMMENAPDGMYIDPNELLFGWTPSPNDVGTHYVNFAIGKRSPADPNKIWISNRCTIVIKIEEWQDPPIFEPMCGGK